MLNIPIAHDAIWTITPITLGRRTAKWSWFNYLESCPESLEIVYRTWLLRHEDYAVLIDTGPPVDEARRRGITDMAPVDQKVRENGVDPDEIQHVVLTHLHWDHASSADKFPRARFYAQQAEIDFFTGEAWDHDATSRFFSHREMLNDLIARRKIIALEGDHKFAPGITLLNVGGHTPGSQMVAVNTPDGLAVLTGDAIPMNRNYVDAIPTGILVNLADILSARKRIKNLMPQSIYTGHDPVARYILQA